MSTARTRTRIRDLANGTPVRVVFEGVVDERTRPASGLPAKGVRVTSGVGAFTSTFVHANLIGGAASIEVLTPEWQPGDVVVVTFDKGSPWEKRFTYVRGSHDWPGDTVRMSDAEVNRRFAAGEIEHVLRDGKPVDAAPKVSLHSTAGTYPF